MPRTPNPVSFRGLIAAAGVLIVLSGPTAAREPDAPDVIPMPGSEDAFATIGGDGYAPMYLRRIAPSLLAVDDRLYCAFQNSQGQPHVMSYDVGSRHWSQPVQASDFGKGKDMHGSPALTVDRSGHFHLFFGCHNDALKHVRTAEPGRIAAWQQMPSPAMKASYPEVIRQADGTLLLFFRAGGHPEPWVELTSTDDGWTWSAPTRIIEMRLDPLRPKAAAYARFFPGTGGSVHCFFNYKEDNPDRWPPAYNGLSKPIYRFNIYYVRRDADGVWRNSGGELVRGPITRNAADARCLVYDSGDLLTYPGAYAVDAEDRPYLVFRTGVLDWDKGGPDQIFRAGIDELNAHAGPVVPLAEYYTTLRNGQWETGAAIPSAWPHKVVNLLTGPGEASWQVTAEQGVILDDESPWFLSFRRQPQPTALFLFNRGVGYARHRDGPVSLP